MELIDIGINLTHDSYDGDRAEVLLRAQRAGVRRLIVMGASAAGSHAARDLAHAHPGVLYATAGVHPHHATEATPEVLAALRVLLADPRVVAAGECGLDYYRNFAPPAAQCAAFEAQLELAAERGKPVFLHQRDAHADFMAILRRHRDRIPRAVAHCFTGTAAELEDCLALDLHIGRSVRGCRERAEQGLFTCVNAKAEPFLMFPPHHVRVRRVLRSAGRELGSLGRGLAVALLILTLAGSGPRPGQACTPEASCAGCDAAPTAGPSCCDPVAPASENGREPSSVASAGCACAIDAGGTAVPALVGAFGSQPLPIGPQAVVLAGEGDPARVWSSSGAPREARPRSPGTPLFLASAALLI